MDTLTFLWVLQLYCGVTMAGMAVYTTATISSKLRYDQDFKDHSISMFLTCSIISIVLFTAFAPVLAPIMFLDRIALNNKTQSTLGGDDKEIK